MGIWALPRLMEAASMPAATARVAYTWATAAQVAAVPFPVWTAEVPDCLGGEFLGPTGVFRNCHQPSSTGGRGDG
jgi:hypothetical protein